MDDIHLRACSGSGTPKPVLPRGLLLVLVWTSGMAFPYLVLFVVCFLDAVGVYTTYLSRSSLAVIMVTGLLIAWTAIALSSVRFVFKIALIVLSAGWLVLAFIPFGFLIAFMFGMQAT